MSEQKTQENYDWSGADARVRELGYRSFMHWCTAHGFSPKTCQGMKRGEVVWKLGPKMSAILDKALADGLVTVKDEVAA